MAVTGCCWIPGSVYQCHCPARILLLRTSIGPHGTQGLESVASSANSSTVTGPTRLTLLRLCDLGHHACTRESVFSWPFVYPRVVLGSTRRFSYRIALRRPRCSRPSDRGVFRSFNSNAVVRQGCVKTRTTIAIRNSRVAFWHI